MTRRRGITMIREEVAGMSRGEILGITMWVRERGTEGMTVYV
jgi:hypothetical protein